MMSTQERNYKLPGKDLGAMMYWGWVGVVGSHRSASIPLLEGEKWQVLCSRKSGPEKMKICFIFMFSLPKG